jgi:hypothetical protein
MYATTTPHGSGRPGWLPCAAIVVALATFGTACASDDSGDVPATTVGGTPSTTVDPADGPQPSLEPGSNLPPDNGPNEPATPNTDDTTGSGTAGITVETTGG